MVCNRTDSMFNIEPRAFASCRKALREKAARYRRVATLRALHVCWKMSAAAEGRAMAIVVTTCWVAGEAVEGRLAVPCPPAQSAFAR